MALKPDKMDIQNLVSKNQRIKIVPSIEESLRESGFNTHLDDQTLNWLKSLKQTWKNWKKSPTAEDYIKSFVQTTPDPYRVILAVLIRCEEYKDCKPKSLPYFIIETFDKIAKNLNLVLDERLKLPAFQIAFQQRNYPFLTLMVSTFEIASIKCLILPKVQAMLAQGNHKQAFYVITALELFNEIPVQDILFPFVLQDTVVLVDEYLNQCPTQVIPFIQFLDKLLDYHVNLRQYAQNYLETNKIAHVKYEKFHQKPLGKLVARLCNKYNVPIKTCTNLSRNRTTRGLRYLVYQKYIQKSITSTVWEDLVKDALKDDKASVLNFINHLVEYDKNEAVKWAQYFQIPKRLCPYIFTKISESNSRQEENWDEEPGVSQEYYKLNLSSNEIVIVDNLNKFNEMIMTLQQYNLIGMDCEWKPSFGTDPQKVSLIQLAVKNIVYLIDSLTLNKDEFNACWHSFNKTLLDNAEIIKVGFGLEPDLKVIKSSISGLSNITLKGEGLLDLSLLWKNLVDAGLQFPHQAEEGASLCSLVKCCYNFPLEKSEQLSNWELRPLRQTQIEYAALDAYVLVEIYDFIKNNSFKQGIDFDGLVNNIMLDVKKKPTKKNKSENQKLEIPPTVHDDKQIRLVTETKLLLEPKVSFLLSYFRYLGIDSTVIPVTMLWHDTIKVAISENRFILTHKMKHSPTLQFHQSSIMAVEPGQIEHQLDRILSNLKIQIMDSDILSRCIYCNNVDLTKLTIEDVKQLYEKYKLNNISVYNTHKYDNYDDDCDRNYDAFLSDSEDEELYQPAANHISQLTVTSKGVSIDMKHINSLFCLQKEALLCNTCGQLLWEGQEIINKCNILIPKLENLSI